MREATQWKVRKCGKRLNTNKRGETKQDGTKETRQLSQQDRGAWHESSREAQHVDRVARSESSVQKQRRAHRLCFCKHTQSKAIRVVQTSASKYTTQRAAFLREQSYQVSETSAAHIQQWRKPAHTGGSCAPFTTCCYLNSDKLRSAFCVLRLATGRLSELLRNSYNTTCFASAALTGFFSLSANKQAAFASDLRRWPFFCCSLFARMCLPGLLQHRRFAGLI